MKIRNGYSKLEHRLTHGIFDNYILVYIKKWDICTHFILIEFDVCKNCFRFYKGLLISYLDNLGPIKPDGLSQR